MGGYRKQRENIQRGSLGFQASHPVAALDDRLSNFLYKQGTHVPRVVWKVFEYSGDGIFWLGLTLSMLVFSRGNRSTLHHQQLWLNFLLGLIIDLVETGLLKAIVRRNRPVYNQVAKDMHVIVAVDQFSFPSGHSSRASFIAIFVVCCVADPNATALIVSTLAWAACIALSRCLMGRHYLGDVVAGIGVGVLTVAVVTQVRRNGKCLLLHIPAKLSAVCGPLGTSGWFVIGENLRGFCTTQGTFARKGLILSAAHAEKLQMWLLRLTIGSAMPAERSIGV
jgi:presqualene diphosphate phosphatase